MIRSCSWPFSMCKTAAISQCACAPLKWFRQDTAVRTHTVHELKTTSPWLFFKVEAAFACVLTISSQLDQLLTDLNRASAFEGHLEEARTLPTAWCRKRKPKKENMSNRSCTALLTGCERVMLSSAKGACERTDKEIRSFKDLLAPDWDFAISTLCAPLLCRAFHEATAS